MTRYLCAHLALVVSLLLATTTTADEVESLADQALFIADSNGVQPAMGTENFDDQVKPVQFSSGGGLSLGGSNCEGQWFVGADYLSVRANFSQATSFVTTDLGPPTSFTYNEFNFNYGDSYRVYGGYRVPECGCEIRFTYTNFDSNGSFQSPQVPAGGLVSFTSPLEVITLGAGDSLAGSARVELDDYDIGFSRTIPLGSPPVCGCPDPCACWCPAWDIMWTGALRISDVESELNFQSDVPSTPTIDNRVGTSRVSFQGVGLRTGMLGRRYFGRDGIVSLYVKGDISLLLGDVEYTAVGTAFSQHSITSTQLVPVTELEAGTTVFLTENATFSAGYILSAWHDLGHRAEYNFDALGVQINGLDDANLLTFDGWFLRTEIAF